MRFSHSIKLKGVERGEAEIPKMFSAHSNSYLHSRGTHAGGALTTTLFFPSLLA